MILQPSLRPSDDVAYLNCAYMSPLMRSAWTPERRVSPQSAPWNHTRQVLYRLRRVRATAAQVLGCSADDVAIVPRQLRIGPPLGMPVKKGRYSRARRAFRQLLSVQRLARTGGAEIVAWPEDNDWTAAVLDSLTADVAMPRFAGAVGERR